MMKTSSVEMGFVFFNVITEGRYEEKWFYCIVSEPDNQRGIS